MRMTILALAIGFAAASGPAWACPMHEQTASNDQVIASSNGKASSTPIPRRQDGKS
jgi:hypothetical protein